MPIYTEVLPERKASKKSAIRWEPIECPECPQTAGVLSIDTDHASARYVVSEFPTGWDGRGFLLAKLTGGTDTTRESYSCFVARNGQDEQCECKGFTRHGTCKHVDAVRALIGNGWL